MGPLLTIVIPSYNMEDYLSSCCESLLVQDQLRSYLEVLIINDGSTDRTKQIAHQYQDHFPEIFRVIDKGNGHYGSCINRSIQEAQGEYIKILDADDSYETTNLELLLQRLRHLSQAKQNLPDLILTDFVTVNAKGKILNLTQFPLPQNTLFSFQIICEKRCQIPMHAIAYRTEILRSMNYHQTEGICYTDTEWSILPMQRVKTAFYFSSVVYRYRVGRQGQSVEISAYRKNFWMLDKVVNNLLLKFREVQSDPKTIFHQYFGIRLERILQDYYDFYLFFSSWQEMKQKLIEFDRTLFQIFPELYAALDSKTIPSKKGFHYIRCWRKKKDASALYLFFLRSYSLLARTLHSFLCACHLLS